LYLLAFKQELRHSITVRGAWGLLENRVRLLSPPRSASNARTVKPFVPSRTAMEPLLLPRACAANLMLGFARGREQTPCPAAHTNQGGSVQVPFRKQAASRPTGAHIWWHPAQPPGTVAIRSLSEPWGSWQVKQVRFPSGSSRMPGTRNLGGRPTGCLCRAKVSAS